MSLLLCRIVRFRNNFNDIYCKTEFLTILSGKISIDIIHIQVLNNKYAVIYFYYVLYIKKIDFSFQKNIVDSLYITLRIVNTNTNSESKLPAQLISKIGFPSITSCLFVFYLTYNPDETFRNLSDFYVTQKNTYFLGYYFDKMFKNTYSKTNIDRLIVLLLHQIEYS